MTPVVSGKLNKLNNPILQAILTLLIMALFNGATSMLAKGGADFESRLPWTLNIAFLFLFAIYNVILGLVFSTKTRYWLTSIVCFIGLVFISASFAQWMSGLEIDEAGSYRWLYFVFFTVYLFIMVIILAIKKIVQLAEQDDHRFDQINNLNN